MNNEIQEIVLHNLQDIYHSLFKIKALMEITDERWNILSDADKDHLS